jgi:hypothetical protein
MIAGVTHLTMEAELKHGIGLGVDLGFELDFTDDIELPAGFEGVECSDYVLPMALLVNTHGIRLEVARHRWQTARRGAFTAVFRSAPPATLGTVVHRPEIGNVLRQAGVLLDPTCMVMTNFGGEAWFDALPSGVGLAGILCYAVDVFTEAEFWSSFAQVMWSGVSADAAWGSISSPLPQAQCQWVIMQSDEVPPTYSMNDSGFPSIGIFSTAIERDLERAEAAGATLMSEPIVTTVGGTLLRVALILTPAGAPVELLADPGSIAR